MQKNLDASLAFLVETLEDLSVNEHEPPDVGGISKGGVTLVTYAEFCAKNGLPPPTADDIRTLPEAQIKAVFAQNFAAPLRFNDLPSGVDAAVLGYAANAGLAGGCRLLSLSTSTWPTSDAMTDQLVQAAAAMEPKSLILALGAAWLAQKFSGTEWADYGHGWTNRAIKQSAFSLPLASGQ